MKPFLRSQLERYAQRHGELDFLLSREDIMSDMAQFLKLSREHAEVTVIAGRRNARCPAGERERRVSSKGSNGGATVGRSPSGPSASGGDVGAPPGLG